MSLYARVVTDDPTNKELDYLVPPPWESKVHVGSRVKVPLRSRDSSATVVALVDESTAPGIKNVAALVSEEPVLDPRMLQSLPAGWRSITVVPWTPRSVARYLK